MSYTLDVGKTENLAIEYLDQNGQPMVPTPTPDAPPAWSQTNASAVDLTAAADGNTAAAKGAAAGDDIVQLDLKVGGKSFSATIDLTVTAVTPVQVLTSVAIVAGSPV